jgi:hypothetical protein
MLSFGRRFVRLGRRLFAITSACAGFVGIRPDGETAGRVSPIVALWRRRTGPSDRRRSIISGGS